MPDADGIAPAPAEARQEVATPEQRPAPQADARPDEDAALLQSPDRDPPLSAEQRRAVQRSLRILGYYDYYIDAIFGPVTRAGIRAYQERIGAEPTGHLSPAQIDRLHAMAERAG
jgi:peptidoglycan hydrolase-like protein with peptidoglycan-binding domain